MTTAVRVEVEVDEADFERCAFCGGTAPRMVRIPTSSSTSMHVCPRHTQRLAQRLYQAGFCAEVDK